MEGASALSEPSPQTKERPTNFYDFIGPLVTVPSPAVQVVSVGLTQFTSPFGVTDWGPRMAAYTVATIPLVVLFVFGMRYDIRGITSGAVKA